AARGGALDTALQLRPADPRARFLRAEVDVRRNDLGAARSRLDGLYAEAHDVQVGIALADVLRRLGDHAAARGVIDEVLPRLAQDEGEVPARAHVVAARLYREEGRVADAQKEYAAALTARPQGRGARLEAATLAVDVGNAAGARPGPRALPAPPP